MLTRPRRLEYFEIAPGVYPLRDWLLGLRDVVTRHRLEVRLRKLEMGNPGNWRSVGEGVQELKEDFGPGYPMYFAEDRDVVVILLAGGSKATQAKDIKLAKAYWTLYVTQNKR